MKLSLNIKTGTLAGKIFEIEKGILTIGRGENCNVRFDPFGEKIASKNHAYIELKADGFYLTDYNSTNGTFLNGQKINTARLNSGDIVHFGKNGVEAAVFITQEIKITELPTVVQPILGADYLRQDSEVTVFKQAFQPIKQSQEPTAVFHQSVETQFYSPPHQPVAQMILPPPINLRNSFSGIGTGADFRAQQPSDGEAQNNIAFGIGIFVVIFLFLVVMSLIILPNLGFGTAIAASIVAFLPAVLYMLPLIWLDRYDPEPVWLLGLAFAWGALVSVIISYFINTAFAEFAVNVFGADVANTVTVIVSAPIFEEGSKGLGVVLLLVFFRRYFDDILDGIVFGGTIALGFATVENVLYYGSALLKGGVELLVGLFVLRGILSPFAHVTFTAMTGIGCGIARESHNPFVRIIMPVLGYGCAILLHFIWNLMATILPIRGLLEGEWWYGYLLLQVPFFLIFIGFAVYIMYRQNTILKEMLAIDVAQGLIPQAHQIIATSAFRSTGWLIEGIFNEKFSARSKYLRAVGKLGLSYWHIQRARAAQGETASYQQNPILRAEVMKWRDKV